MRTSVLVTSLAATAVAGTLLGMAVESQRHSQPAPSAQIILPSAYASSCVVTKITDGDTLRCGELRIRLLGIDTPERSQGELGDSATAALTRLAPPTTTVFIEYDKERTDRYGRTLAYLYNEAGQFVNEELVAGGYALRETYEPNNKYSDRLGAAQARARISGHGLWQMDGFACTPRSHRRKEC